uniref:Glycerol-3-phosphate dehydrogenase n=1 Tax=Echinococcus granulosus TaxID=6210 RepID=A0A068WET3_ECHGR|nr:glycerol 3 phosphate dehydrogenase [Echinococcus granulosus]
MNMMAMKISGLRVAWQRLLVTGTVAGLGTLAVMEYAPKLLEAKRMRASRLRKPPPEEELALFRGPLTSRQQNIDRMMKNNDVFDILVIGGGATGTGVALDAVTRGLTTCLVEKQDFASGTSSRSTKLIHGGVRYLQKAVFNLDLEQYRMVREALSERANLLDIAPHIAHPLPIMLPIYKWWQVPYYWLGIKMYDLVSGTQILKSSYFLNKSRSMEIFPHLKNEKLKGALVYYDGQHDDARMCLDVAFTASRYGAAIANYVEVLELLKGPSEDPKQKDVSGKPKLVVNGARLRDLLSGKEFVVRARCVVNATGPFTDEIRKMENNKLDPICQPSSGVHIVLPNYYSPENMGLLDPSTTDGRVIFFLPWLGHVVAGTTDHSCKLATSPEPTDDDVQFILSEIKSYLSPDLKVRRGDVLSVWSGIRPLVSDPNSKDTQSIARNHVITVGENNLVTIAGGKWTTYRKMAEETVDECVKVCGLKPKSKCRTVGLRLNGAHGWSPNLFIQLSQEYGIDRDVAIHLASTYGGHAVKVAQQAKLTGRRYPLAGRRLHPNFPIIEAEVTEACREYACNAIDFLARRTRLAFLDVRAAEEVLPKLIDLMAAELNWCPLRKKKEFEVAMKFLKTEMGLAMKRTKTVPANFSPEEVENIRKQFSSIDVDGKGYITLNDLHKFFAKQGESVSNNTLESILSDLDLDRNGEIDQVEFLEFMSSLKTGAVPHHTLKSKRWWCLKRLLCSGNADRLLISYFLPFQLPFSCAFASAVWKHSFLLRHNPVPLLIDSMCNYGMKVPSNPFHVR